MVSSGTTQLHDLAVSQASLDMAAFFSTSSHRSPSNHHHGLQHLGEVAVKGKGKDKFGFLIWFGFFTFFIHLLSLFCI